VRSLFRGEVIFVEFDPKKYGLYTRLDADVQEILNRPMKELQSEEEQSQI
jgi:hypothetical protein